MKAEEIKKWKRSALAATSAGKHGEGLFASTSGAGALWEIALQLAILNERESGIRRLDARAVHAIVQEVTNVAHANQKMLRRIVVRQHSRK